MQNPFDVRGISAAKMLRLCPKDGCVLVFNTDKVGTWRTTATRLGYSCYVTDPHVAHGFRNRGEYPTSHMMRDLYIIPNEGRQP